MKTSFKLFDFKGIPVNIKIWFLLLFALAPPLFVLILFLSVLAHELAHAWVANHLGHKVHQVYIDFMGGAAEMDVSNMHEIDSIKVVAAGPLSNLILYILSISAISIFGENEFLKDMSLINLLLFIFNTLPIYPMDGGRMVRDSLYLYTKNRKKSREFGTYISLFFITALLIYSIVTFSIFMIIFCGVFFYLNFKEMKWIN